MGSRYRRHRWRALLLLVAASCVLTCRRGGEGRGDGPFPGAPVVLISIDTLRSDHLPAYGYHGVETPAIDSLRQEAVLFSRAYSHIPLTLPSHVSILTGELPTVHGVRDNVGYRYDAKRWPSLAVELGRAGYATGGFVSAFVLRGETGVASGFATWDDNVQRRFREVLGNSQRAGTATVAAATRWLDTVGDRPFFLFVHLYDPHSPYTPPEPFASRYRLPYDGEIAAADAAVGELLAELKRRELYDRAIVALLSDHGEGLGEHGEAEHGLLLYREALQVPLLLKLPGGNRGGSRVDEPVQLVDVFPTLMSLAGVERQGKAPLAGRSLLARGGKPRDIYSETFYPRLHFGWSELVSVIRDRFHYIHGPAPELFDLAADAAERHDVLRQQRRVYSELRRVAQANAKELVGPAAEDAETLKRLAALGYAATTAKVGAGEALPDPRQRIHLLAQLQEGANLVNQHRYAEAVAMLQRLTAESPNMADAWEQLGTALQGAGRLEDALAAYQQALKVSVGASHVAVSAGTMLLALGRNDEAKAHAELALAASPALAHDLLARVALAQGHLEAAEREARQALASGGEHVPPLLTLAEVQTKAGKLDEGLRTVQQAEEEVRRQGGNQRMAGLQQVRGDLLARLGRAPEAEAAFLDEIKNSPSSLRAYSGLALLYAAQGRANDAVGVLQRMVEGNGSSPLAYAEAVRTLRALGDPQDASALLRHALGVHPGSKLLRSLSVSPG